MALPLPTLCWDSQATSGDYILTASMGPVSRSRSVEVKPYTLPRFKVNFASDQAFYLPGEQATGTVDAQYFFGQPVAGGQVTIKGFVTDVERVQVFEVSGMTDEEGFYRYDFQIPDYFVGQLQNNSAEVDLEITVTDTANHAESIDETVTVAEKTILIDAIPESGFLQPGLENIVYLQTEYPDGRAVSTTVQIASPILSETVTVATDEYGLATVRLTPPGNLDVSLTLTATTAAASANSVEASSSDQNPQERVSCQGEVGFDLAAESAICTTCCAESIDRVGASGGNIHGIDIACKPKRARIIIATIERKSCCGCRSGYDRPDSGSGDRGSY
ncbi:MAG: hypothetical protein HC778_01285 [Chamaesiphon sp. CSU_1_12]|nr:hypothetical protein [Chamaesiphon sp. CSU_1_12]